MTLESPTVLAEEKSSAQTPGESPDSGAEQAHVTTTGRLAKLMAASRKQLGKTLFFTYLGIYTVAGVALLHNGDQLTWVGVLGFTISMLARYFLHEKDSRELRLLKCFGDIAAVVLMASIVRDTFADHTFLKWSGYVLTAVFCWVSAKVFDREVFGNSDSRQD